MMVPRAGRLAFVALLMLAGRALGWARGSDAPDHWVGTWACSPMLPGPKDVLPTGDLAGATLRQVVQVSIGGRRIRVRLSNAFGARPLAIASVRIGKAASGAQFQPGSDREVTFDGAAAAVIPAGAPLVSDPLDFDLAARSDVTIEITFRNAPADVPSHPGSRTTSYLDAAGRTFAFDRWYVINGLDVLDEDPGSGSIAILGDSITDGRGSTTNGNDRWPDQLARRLEGDPATADIGVLNQGIGGNRLLRNGLGPNALARFDRDVLAQTGVRWVIVYEGVNDIGTGSTAPQIIAAYEQCVRRAHAQGLRIFGATITPFAGTRAYGAPPNESVREAVNAWIRRRGVFDGLIDFDAAVRDPNRPDALYPPYDSGDHLHLNPRGYHRMAEAVDLGLFATPPLLSPIFGDHMVVQRGRPAVFWGWATPGRQVEVDFAGRRASATAGRNGRWEARVDPPPAGGPYTLRVAGDGTRTLRDVLVGDVWLCGGQSNMEFALKDAAGAAADLTEANLPSLRLCKVEDRVAYAPARTVPCSWQVCSPESAAPFSAVAYYFGRKLAADLHVPIGLVEDCVGGSPAQSWMGAATLKRLGGFGPQLAQIAWLHARGGPEYGSFLMHWLDQYDRGGRDDAWARPGFDDQAWQTVSIPGGAFQEPGVGASPAVVWFRRDVELPNPLPAGVARIQLGVIERMDTVYVNGRWVGASSWVEHPRDYPIPADALKPGRNAIALRVFRSLPSGGFLSPASALRIVLGDGRVIPLAGTWRAAVSVVQRPPIPPPLDLDNYPTMPAVLYDGMIAPLEPLSMKGVIWYQGEANAWSPPEQYGKLLTALIGEWREKFGDGPLPFYIVQLPAFLPHRTEPGGTDGWTELRAAQAKVARTVPGTALVVTVDTGAADNIHPTEKRPVGERLALCALAGAYGKRVVSSGPTLRSVQADSDGSLRLVFGHADGGLRVHGATLGEFSVQAADGSWHWAQARLDGSDAVIVSAPGVLQAKAVRYAWQANPMATLFNGAGLPAMPFQEDIVEATSPSP